MNIKIKVVSLLLAVIMVAGVFGGCSKIGGVNTDDYSKVVVATYGDKNIYLDEVNFFARNSQYVYESYYGTDIWSNEQYSGIGDYLMQSIVSSLYQTEVLVDKAAELGITLSDEDKEKAAAAVEEFFSESDEKLIEACDVTKERLTEIFEKNALANRVYESTYIDKDCSVTDEEAAQSTVDYILVPASEGEDKAKEVLEAVSGGKDIKEAAEEYGFSTSTISFGSGDYDNEIGTVSKEMSEGEYAIANVESDGWYVMYMKDKFDESATENKKKTLENNKKVDFFKEVYAQWVEEGPKFKVDESILSLISFTKSIYEAPETTEAEDSSDSAQTTEAETASDSAENTEE